jgi:Icc-related predicted phosphoesterase
MRVLTLSDIHGDIDNLERILDRERETAYDLILVLGDITDIEHDDYVERARAIIELLDDQGTFVKAIPGNMDDERILELLINNRVNLHKDLFTMEHYDFIGFGGGSTPFDTPFEPDDAERGQVLRTLLQRTASPYRAIVSHHPPQDTLIDRTADGDQVGSPALRELIENEDVRIVFSGHIHEAAGKDRLGDTVMVNPGPVTEGKYAVVDMADDITVEFNG